jgi:DNA transposition AAA+ family ATPase
MKEQTATTTPAADAGLYGLAREQAAANVARYGAEAAATLMQAWDHAAERKLSSVRLAKLVGVHDSTLSRLFRGQYQDTAGRDVTPSADTLAAIARGVAADRDRASLAAERRAAAPAEFVETEEWRKVQWLCNAARRRRKMAFLYGESQHGKTTYLREYARRSNGLAHYVEIPPAATIVSVARAFAREFAVEAGTDAAAVLDRIAERCDDSHVVLVDEVFRMWKTAPDSTILKVLDFVRGLHDRVGCGVVLCGTALFQEEVTTGKHEKWLAQLRERAAYQFQLPRRPAAASLRAIHAAYNLPEPEGDDAELEAAVLRSQSLGSLFARLGDAWEMADGKGQPVSWQHVRDAVRLVERMAQREGKGGAA